MVIGTLKSLKIMLLNFTLEDGQRRKLVRIPEQFTQKCCHLFHKQNITCSFGTLVI